MTLDATVRAAPRRRSARRWRRLGPEARLWLRSPLARRVLAVNLIAVLIPIGGLSYLGVYQDELYAARLRDVAADAATIADALGTAAAVNEDALTERFAALALRRLTPPTQRARFYDPFGALIADTRGLTGPYGRISVAPLPALAPPSFWDRAGAALSGLIAPAPSPAGAVADARDPPAVLRDALGGDPAAALHGPAPLTAAAPVRRYRQVLGAVLLTSDAADIVGATAAAREKVLAASAVALTLTIALSIYLAATIVRPIRKLAAGADAVRRGRAAPAPGEDDGDGEAKAGYWTARGRHTARTATGAIPDFAARGDEIGDLSQALRRMTEQLWRRMDALEEFAADVAHEVKNPLSSLSSAIETLERLNHGDAQAAQLLEIVADDVRRLDRLISDLSDYSRVEAELSRSALERFSLRSLLKGLAALHREAWAQTGPQLALDVAQAPADIVGDPDRLAQVVRNLMINAGSFCPPHGVVRLGLRPAGGGWAIVVEDDGPGLPPGREEAVFERFYTTRPAGEAFGRHSGLGLAISRRIMEAHGGTLTGENRDDAPGARFIATLPSDVRG